MNSRGTRPRSTRFILARTVLYSPKIKKRPGGRLELVGFFFREMLQW